MTDVLSDILDTLRLKGTLYFRTSYSPPWGVAVPQLKQAARFHLVVQGSCHIGFESGGAVTLGPGDLIVIPRGRAHTLADAPNRPTPPLETLIEDTGYTGEGVFAIGSGDTSAATQLVCGHLSFRDGADHPLLRALPDHIVVRAAQRVGATWLDETLRLAVRQAFSDAPGATASINRLTEVVFIEVLRRAVETTPALGAILSALSDAYIGKALALLHEAPDRAWTVDGLATAVGMSRSRFAERFSGLVGIGPMAYLADWRLQRALQLLAETQTSVKAIARQSGYLSPAAFTRAFVQRFGVPPTDFRRPDTA